MRTPPRRAASAAAGKPAAARQRCRRIRNSPAPSRRWSSRATEMRPANGSPTWSPASSGARSGLPTSTCATRTTPMKPCRTHSSRCSRTSPRYREDLPFEVWFTRILVNGCLDMRKSRARRLRWALPMSSAPDTPPPDPAAPAAVARGPAGLERTGAGRFQRRSNSCPIGSARCSRSATSPSTAPRKWVRHWG